MSSCRMCDTCGTVFSERAEGWSNGEITINKKDPDTGRVRPETISVDKCPECTEQMTATPPRPMLEHGARNEYIPQT